MQFNISKTLGFWLALEIQPFHISMIIKIHLLMTVLITLPIGVRLNPTKKVSISFAIHNLFNKGENQVTENDVVVKRNMKN